MLGTLLLDRVALEEADRHAREAVALAGWTLRPGNWRRAESESLLGDCLTARGRYDDAEPLLLTSSSALRTSLVSGHGRTRKSLERLTALYTAWDEPKKAEEYRRLLRPAESTGQDQQ